MSKSLSRGFTLVELLIVIALLGVIATIVIAAINPIEQANKARDAKFEADSSQMISAIERYYASNSQFPWMAVTPATYTSADISFPFTTATNDNVGLCGTSGCTSQPYGVLISSDELKNEFLSRDFITDTSGDVTKKLWIGKAQGSSSSVYGCFVPEAQATRNTAIKNGKVVYSATAFGTTPVSAFSATGTPSYTTTQCQTAADTNWGTGNCVVCIPQ